MRSIVLAEQTEFNGVKILSKDQNLAIPVGANDGKTVDIELNQLNIDKLGIKGFSVVSGYKILGHRSRSYNFDGQMGNANVHVYRHRGNRARDR